MPSSSSEIHMKASRIAWIRAINMLRFSPIEEPISYRFCNSLIVNSWRIGSMPRLTHPCLTMNKAGIYEHSPVLPFLKFWHSPEQWISEALQYFNLAGAASMNIKRASKPAAMRIWCIWYQYVPNLPKVISGVHKENGSLYAFYYLLRKETLWRLIFCNTILVQTSCYTLEVNNVMIKGLDGVIASNIFSASDRHLTLASFGKISLKSSQCMRVANPPAEHPERSASLALDNPMEKSSSIIALQISWPLKKSFVPLLNSLSRCPAKDAPSQ